MAVGNACAGIEGFVRAFDLLGDRERWLGLSEQARRLDKWIVCRVLCRCEKRLIEVGVVRS
ncbi:hypothetical protein VQ045_20050, partial [Aurantimonas sp. E1-2-R+4]|uniref:hypothetical protein n=1 Tax=Aurantimonas sp. E1-2-R+4 TaxID=3113714 RepID=UPI002F93636E